MSRSSQRGRGRAGAAHGASGDGVEWVGGRLRPPFFIEDREEPYRVEIAVWMELPSGLVVGQEVVTPERVSGALGRVLEASFAKPLAGRPRRPARLRVADPVLAHEVREVVGAAIPVTVSPTPELDSLLANMLEHAPGHAQELGASYLEDGRIPADVVARLFEAARLLYTLKPWETVGDDRVFRMDIPALGVEGACVSIIGALGESLGFLVFPSFSAYQIFADEAELQTSREGPLDFGTGWLSLGFDRGADLPATMRKEVSAHGWPVADANAYPHVERRDPDGTPRPLVPRDVAIATACAMSLGAFFVKHAGYFDSPDPEPICESWFDRDDLEVRFTHPYEAFELFEIAEARDHRAGAQSTLASGVRAGESDGRAPVAGRNAPCPCGSGRKYKKCCLHRAEAVRTARGACESERELDERTVRLLGDFANRRFGAEWRCFASDFGDVRHALPLAMPWGLYHFRVEGATVCEHLLRERGRSLLPAERAWLEAQQAAWLSVWEVTAVVPGESVAVLDLLSGETRVVKEQTASRSLVARDAVLARVVHSESAALFCGLYPRALPPMAAAEVVRRARGRLRLRRSVPVERLRDERFGRALIRIWEESVAEVDAALAAARAHPSRLQNTDGDPFLLTNDRFDIAPGEAAAVEACLAALPGVGPAEHDAGDPEVVYVFMREGNRVHASWENTVVGRAVVAGDTLRLETNSRARADSLRAQVEAACGTRIRHRARDHADPLSQRAERSAGSAPVPASGEIQQALLDFKRRHYADWIDQPLPALAGGTPRRAARTAAGRAAVDVLLKDMENHEQRAGDGAPFDFSEIRRALRLDRPRG